MVGCLHPGTMPALCDKIFQIALPGFRLGKAKGPGDFSPGPCSFRFSRSSTLLPPLLLLPVAGLPLPLA